MLKVVLFWWVLGPGGAMMSGEIAGWRDMGACNAAGVSLTEPNPVDGWSPVVVVWCEGSYE